MADKKRTFFEQNVPSSSDDLGQKKETKRQRTLEDFWTISSNSNNNNQQFDKNSNQLQTDDNEKKRHNYHKNHHHDHNKGRHIQDDDEESTKSSKPDPARALRERISKKYDDSTPTFIKLPHYSSNVIISNTLTQDGNQKQQVVHKWPKIKSLLEEKIESIEDFEDIMFSLHPEWQKFNSDAESAGRSKPYDIELFKCYVMQKKTPEDRTKIFNSSLPQIQNWVLELPKFFPSQNKIRNLKRNTPGDVTSVELTDSQIVRLVAAAFFSLFGIDSHSEQETQKNDFDDDDDEDNDGSGKYFDRFPSFSFQVPFLHFF